MPGICYNNRKLTNTQPKYPSLYIHTMECYSALKWNEILICATTWMKVEDIMPDTKEQILWRGRCFFLLPPLLEQVFSLAGYY
jgi:hypothetical protein